MKNSTWLIIILLVIVVLSTTFAKPIKKFMTRGYQNNNFGNIRKTKEKWQGEIDGKDKDFKTFKNPAYGYRSMFILLKTYFSMGKNTIQKIINTYAPTNENDTLSYVKSVSSFTAIPENKQLSVADHETLKKLVAAISYHENGIKPNLTDIENGYKLFIS